ncbi:MAG: Omp28 family outer membrane lipoprotein [Muribaculaceae bacterium]|nr:Omp28 family outer membrane lipoprotein [Muribaculaceae bacterium]
MTPLHRLTISTLLTAGALSLGSCDDVSPDERYIDMGAADVRRNVLLEDFTGQNCRNCPDAHKVIESLEALYGENIIAVSIHGGNFAIPVADSWISWGYIGLASPEGIAYNDAKGLTSWPAGEIDRSGTTLEHDKWSDAVRSRIERPAQADIDITAAVADGLITVTTAVTPREDYSGNLQLWVTESGIIASQNDNGTEIPAYVHNNVLRAAVNGTWGEPLSGKAGQTVTVTHTIPLRHNDQEQWNPSSLSIVGFVYDSQGVGQAEKTPVTVATEE